MPSFLKSVAVLLVVSGASFYAKASEILFLNNPSRIEISDGASTIASNEPLKIWYDSSRLSKCTSSNRMQQSFLTLSYSFDGGSVQKAFLQGPEALTAQITIPQGAQTVTMWFHQYTLSAPNSEPTCDAYDSNFGRNFQFQIR